MTSVEKNITKNFLDKIPDENIFIKNFLYLYESLDRMQIEKDIDKLRNIYPEKNEDELVKVCINNFAKKSSFWGGLSAMPGCIPGFGTVLQVGTALADSFALIRSQSVLILAIASLYGFNPSSEERITEVLMILSGNTSLQEADEARFRTEVLKGGTARIVKNILASMSGCFCRRSVFRFLPLAGIAAGAGMNYFSTVEMGKKAHEYYRRHRHREGRNYE
jgi:hypothetical protein